MMDTIAVRDTPVGRASLRYTAPDAIKSQEDLASVALDAVFRFCHGLCEPLAVDLWVVCCDGETGYPLGDPIPPRPFWQLQKKKGPSDVQIRPAWKDEQIATTDILSADAIMAWVEGALRQTCDGGRDVRPGWMELLFRAVRVRLPLSSDAIAGETLRVSVGAGSVDHPIERCGDSLWIVGPIARKTPTAPLELRVSNEAGLLTLDLSLFWSVWAEDAGPGHDEIHQRLSQLVSRGWQAAE